MAIAPKQSVGNLVSTKEDIQKNVNFKTILEDTEFSDFIVEDALQGIYKAKPAGDGVARFISYDKQNIYETLIEFNEVNGNKIPILSGKALNGDNAFNFASNAGTTTNLDRYLIYIGKILLPENLFLFTELGSLISWGRYFFHSGQPNVIQPIKSPIRGLNLLTESTELNGLPLKVLKDANLLKEFSLVICAGTQEYCSIVNDYTFYLTKNINTTSNYNDTSLQGIFISNLKEALSIKNLTYVENIDAQKFLEELKKDSANSAYDKSLYEFYLPLSSTSVPPTMSYSNKDLDMAYNFLIYVKSARIKIYERVRRIAIDIAGIIAASRLAALDNKVATREETVQAIGALQQKQIDESKLTLANANAADATKTAKQIDATVRGVDAFELQRFNTQCFMLDFIDLFQQQYQKIREEYVKQNLPIHNGKVILVKGKPDNLINKIFGTEKKASFMELSSEQISFLTPKIRFHKVHYPVENGAPVDYPIPFSTNVGWLNSKQSSNLLNDIYIEKTNDSNNPFVSLSDREFGVGIKSFSWDYEGSNPVSARKDISATLVLKAANFDALCRTFPVYDFTNKEFINFKYIDLILRTDPKYYAAKTPSVFVTKPKTYNPNYFVYRVDLGFQEIKDTNTVPISFTDDQLQAINENHVTLNLVLIDHKFTFNNDGSLDIEIKYRAYFEAALMDNEADVLATKEILESRAERVKKLQDLESLCSGFDDEETRSKAQKEIEKVTQQFAAVEFRELKESYGRIIASLRDKGNIYYAKVNKSTLNGYNISRTTAGLLGAAPPPSGTSNKLINWTPSVTNPPNVNNPTGPTTVTSKDSKDKLKEEISKYLQTIAPVEETNGEILISFFYLGDLINSLIDNIINANKNSSMDFITNHTRIVLGSFNVQANFKDYTMSIGEIPISVEYFSEWFLNRVVAEKKITYHLLTFLRDIASHMITDLFGSKCSLAYNRVPNKIQMTNFIMRSAGGRNSQEFFQTQPSDNGIYDFDNNDLNIAIQNNRTTIQNTKSQNLFHYNMIYALSTNYVEIKNGDKQQDKKSGIYHIEYGRNKGIVKKIDFERTEIKGMRELNFIREYDGRGYAQLHSTYNANVTTVGNYMFFPGERVYIDSTGFGNSLGEPNDFNSISNQLGLGGYHYIYRVSNTISPGKFDTTFKAKWESSGVPKGRAKTINVAPDSEKPTDLKACTTAVSVVIGEYKDKVEPLDAALTNLNDAGKKAEEQLQKETNPPDTATIQKTKEEVEKDLRDGKLSATSTTDQLSSEIVTRIKKKQQGGS
jgi:hypothetical protein